MTKHSHKTAAGGRGGGHRRKPAKSILGRRQVVRDALVHAGLSVPDPAPLTQARPLTTEQRKVLAQQVGRGRPLSEYIREEREGR